eukprot:scaffold36470_cov79-Phaeocystis_antarctica.AAC.1
MPPRAFVLPRQLDRPFPPRQRCPRYLQPRCLGRRCRDFCRRRCEDSRLNELCYGSPQRAVQHRTGLDTATHT